MNNTLQRFEARCAAMSKRALGRDYTVVLLEKGTNGALVKFSGRIVACEFAGTRARQASWVAQFNITLEGPTGRRETVLVERLPR